MDGNNDTAEVCAFFFFCLFLAPAGWFPPASRPPLLESYSPPCERMHCLVGGFQRPRHDPGKYHSLPTSSLLPTPNPTGPQRDHPRPRPPLLPPRRPRALPPRPRRVGGDTRRRLPRRRRRRALLLLAVPAVFQQHGVPQRVPPHAVAADVPPGALCAVALCLFYCAVCPLLRHPLLSPPSRAHHTNHASIISQSSPNHLPLR